MDYYINLNLDPSEFCAFKFSETVNICVSEVYTAYCLPTFYKEYTKTCVGDVAAMGAAAACLPVLVSHII